MSHFEILVIDYANFSNSSISIALLAIKLNKTTREIKYLRKTEPWIFQDYLKQYQKELDSIKSIEYPPVPQGWFQRFLQSGGLTMINGQSLPSLDELRNSNNVF